MNRRGFIRTVGLGSALMAHTLPPAAAAESRKAFTMKFAPHIGQFAASAGASLLDQVRFAHAQGFIAWEDNRASTRTADEQAALGSLLRELGMTMGVFVAYSDFKNPTFAGHRPDRDNPRRDLPAVKAALEKKMQEAVAIARRLGARWTTVTPGGADPSLSLEAQTENAAELLRFCADILEPAGVVAVLEPLNRINHPGAFLQRISHARQICQLVNRPAVRILDDFYHQQINEGNLINNLEEAWDEIAYVQIGEVPGRKEPGTGEVDFRYIMQWLHARGFQGVVGMEHSAAQKGVEGERKLVEVYRSIDGSLAAG